MKRNDFIKRLGLSSAGVLVAPSVLTAKSEASEREMDASGTCVLIPTETAGPFPLDLTANTTFYRADITEDRTGVPLNVKLKILGEDNCGVMQNVRVNIWHCDKDGLYSGYSQTNNPGQAGLTYLRGYQMTDSNGEVEFQTIFPGWYSGRICHIHFQVYVSSSYAAISQLTFDVATKNSIYTNNSSLYTKGTDPMTLASDNIFSDGYTYQMATLTANSTTGGYDAYLEVTVEGNGVLGLGHLEKENAKYFSLGQNYPNPYEGLTTIPLEIMETSDVTIDVWDINGKEMGTIFNQSLAPGQHEIEFNASKFNIPAANYMYRVTVSNSNGTFIDAKLMTAK